MELKPGGLAKPRHGASRSRKHNYNFIGVLDPNGLQKAILSMMRGTIESDYGGGE